MQEKEKIWNHFKEKPWNITRPCEFVTNRTETGNSHWFWVSIRDDYGQDLGWPLKPKITQTTIYKLLILSLAVWHRHKGMQQKFHYASTDTRNLPGFIISSCSLFVITETTLSTLSINSKFAMCFQALLMRFILEAELLVHTKRQCTSSSISFGLHFVQILSWAGSMGFHVYLSQFVGYENLFWT